MTDTKQPEALRLAVIHEFLADQSKHDEEKTIIVQLFKDSAIELRRLHEVNAELLEALKCLTNEMFEQEVMISWDDKQKALAAIAKATGESK
jgi:hemoglobin-like flavoprotein